MHKERWFNVIQSDRQTDEQREANSCSAQRETHTHNTNHISLK